MYFSVGIETPEQGQALGLVVPALCNDKFSCYSAADTQQDIAPNVTEAISMMLELMQDEGILVAEIKDAGVLVYQSMADYQHCDAWVLVYVDMSAFEGKPKRINVSMPDTLIGRIDRKVKIAPDQYRDRSHFLAIAARHELESSET